MTADQGGSSEASSSHQTQPQFRPRYLRACDRCRIKKTKCDDKEPCGNCVKCGAECTFEMSVKASGSREHTADPPVKKRKSRIHEEEDDAKGSGTNRRKKAISQASRESNGAKDARPHLETRPSISGESNSHMEDTSRQSTRLDLASSTHFFSGRDGTTRIIGPTSGIALLDAARLISETSRHKTSTQPEQDWAMMSRLLGPDEVVVGSPSAPDGEDDEYFPDRQEKKKVAAGVNIFAEITLTIPLDLLASLVNTFFELIHASWPLVHPPTFFSDLYQWSDPSCGLLVVAMCMLASRYSTDIRVYADAGDPCTAGKHLQALFDRLSRLEQGNHMYEIMAYFFIAQYYCTDNVPQSQASVYFGIAFAKSVDFGLHRYVPANVPMSEIDREIRKDGVGDLLVLAHGCTYYLKLMDSWDKQISALYGRHPFNRIFQINIDMPLPFPDHNQSSELRPLLLDRCYVEIYQAFISASALVDFTLNHVSPHSQFPDSRFMDSLVTRWNLDGYEDGLSEAEKILDEWKLQLPPSLTKRDITSRFASPLHSIASEQVAGTEMLVKMLIYGRRLFLATVAAAENENEQEEKERLKLGKALRQPLMQVAKDLVQSGIQLGATGKLKDTDILFVYRVLVAGRLLLSCSFCAKAEGDLNGASECRRAVQAALMLLDRLAELHPYSLGAAETLEETCRICSLNFEPSSRSRKAETSNYRPLWYRPLGNRRAMASQSPVDKISVLTQARTPRPTASGQQASIPAGAQPDPILPTESVDPALADPLSSFLNTSPWGEIPDGIDLGWLLPAGLGDLNGNTNDFFAGDPFQFNQ